MRTIKLITMLLGATVLAVSSPEGPRDNGPVLLKLEEVTQRMVQADRWRTTSLQHYTSLRRYRVENRRFHKRAEMVVRVKYAIPGRKEFEVISESGSGAVRRRALRRMIDTEQKTSEDEEAREHTRITPENYQLRLLGTDLVEGRSCYRIEAEPRSKNTLLFRGLVWVDAEDFAVVRVQGSPAKNPSFWTRKVQFTQRYAKVGPFWLPASNYSKTDVWIFGSTEVSVEYYDYQIDQPTGPVDTAEENSK